MVQQPQKKRGVIILDTCALIQMERENVNFVPILEKLSTHGYKILIPEVVAVEAGGTLADGTDVQSLFEADRYPHPKIAPFLEKVGGASVYPFKNIQIVSNTGPENADAYCNALRHALKMAPAQRVDAVKAANNRYKSPDLGDDAILSLLGKPLTQGTSSPVFVLTNDKGLKDRINFLNTRENRHVESFNTASFYKSLHDSGTWKALKLVIPHRPCDVANERFTDTLKALVNDLNPAPQTTSTNGTIASIVAAGPGATQTNGVAATTEHPAGDIANVSETDAHPRVARFIERFGAHLGTRRTGAGGGTGGGGVGGVG